MGMSSMTSFTKARRPQRANRPGAISSKKILLRPHAMRVTDYSSLKKFVFFGVLILLFSVLALVSASSGSETCERRRMPSLNCFGKPWSQHDPPIKRDHLRYAERSPASTARFQNLVGVK